MEKFIGVILMGLAAAISFYMFTHLDNLNNITIPVPEKVINYFKVEVFK